MTNGNIYRKIVWAHLGDGSTSLDYENWCKDTVASMVLDWARYATWHRTRCHSGIDADGVLGAAWEAIGRGLRELLNGETPVDAGTLDSIIVAIFKNEGIVV